ncbi:MAG: velvet factor-domain-containing protein [Benjaminiella poitrasii]|nr:MAG: velvet factor-domain-containing protein [Benjaminiella poitrasii]
MTLTHSNTHSSGCTYRFIESSLANLPPTIGYDLEIRQQPDRAKMSIINERDRRPIEPPPILQLHWQNCSNDELKKYLQSPFYFTVANLVTEDDPETPLLPIQKYLSGSTVSSLYRLRDIDNSDGGFFVFGDLAVKKEGRFKLRFSLFEIVEGQVRNQKTILSNTFTVYIPKQFPGPTEATFLSRTFSDQGVKMRIRKEHRLQSRKRKSDRTQHAMSNEHGPPQKKYQAKNSKLIVSSPPYAESFASSSEVLFGRWQAMSHSNMKQNESEQSPYREPLSPPPLNNNNIQDVSNSMHDHLKNTLRYPYPDDHAHAFPSPESTIYNTMSSSNISTTTTTTTPRSMSWGYHYPQARDAYNNNRTGPVSRNSWLTSHPHSTSSFSSTTTTTHSSNASMTNPSSPVLVASSHFTDSPPTMAMELPSDLSLAKYHTCSDRKYPARSSVDRLPTPPISITELHHLATGAPSWGARLPPLRAIMNNVDSMNHLTQEQSIKQPTSSLPLILPPPIPVSTFEQSAYYPCR